MLLYLLNIVALACGFYGFFVAYRNLQRKEYLFYER